jgi:hypothetical protein
MDLRKLADQAKRVVDKRGGPESLKEDAQELRDIADSPGSASDKLKAAAQAIKQPGAAKTGPGDGTDEGGSGS